MWLLISIGAVLLAVLAQAIISRTRGQITQLVRFMLVGIVVGLLLAALLLRDYGLSPETISGLLVYAFACELYIFLFTMALSSVSANLLLRFSRKSHTEDEILHSYGGERMVDRRLDRLVEGGLLRRTAGSLELTGKGARLLRLFDWLHCFFGFQRMS